MKRTEDSGTGITNRNKSSSDNRTSGMAWVLELVPACIKVPWLAYRWVTTPANGAVMRA